MKTARPTLRSPSPGPGREAGYNMAILIIAITVLNVMLAVALPQWSQLIKRDKEAELRSRGLQYAEAIRIFQTRYGRLPVRLEELIEVKPRSIRRLWDDPMTDDGKWGIIFQQAGRPQPGQPSQPGEPGVPEPPAQGEELVPQAGTTVSVPGGGTGLAGADGRRVTIGPIAGVHSLSEEGALGSFFGATSYNQWLFRVDLLQRPIGRPDQQAQLPRLDLRNLGRPFRQGLDLAPKLPGDALATSIGGANRGGFGAGGRQGRQGGFQQPGQVPGGRAPGVVPSGNAPRRRTPGVPRAPTRPGGPREGAPRETPGGTFPGAPGFPGGGNQGGSGPGGSDPGGSGPGGTPPGGSPPGGFDPTVPQNVSPSTFLAPPHTRP